MEYFRYIIFECPRFKNGFTITRSKKYGGDVYIDNYQQLVLLLKSDTLHPQDIKIALIQMI